MNGDGLTTCLLSAKSRQSAFGSCSGKADVADAMRHGSLITTGCGRWADGAPPQSEPDTVVSTSASYAPYLLVRFSVPDSDTAAHSPEPVAARFFIRPAMMTALVRLVDEADLQEPFGAAFKIAERLSASSELRNGLVRRGISGAIPSASA